MRSATTTDHSGKHAPAAHRLDSKMGWLGGGSCRANSYLSPYFDHFVAGPALLFGRSILVALKRVSFSYNILTGDTYGFDEPVCGDVVDGCCGSDGGGGWSNFHLGDLGEWLSLMAQNVRSDSHQDEKRKV